MFSAVHNTVDDLSKDYNYFETKNEYYKQWYY